MYTVYTVYTNVVTLYHSFLGLTVKYKKKNNCFTIEIFNISDGFLDFDDSPDIYYSVQKTNKGLNGVHCEHEDSILQLEENCIRISGTAIFMYIVLYNCKLSQLSKYNYTKNYRNHIYHIRPVVKDKR